jgi:hypothetical protein
LLQKQKTRQQLPATGFSFGAALKQQAIKPLFASSLR